MRFTRSVLNPVDSDAASIAPAFIALALWLGAAAGAAVLPGADMRAVLAGRTVRALAASLVPYLLLGAVQALALGAVLVALGLPVASAPALVGLMVLGSVAFSAVACAARLALRRVAVPAMLGALVAMAACSGAILPAGFAGGAFDALGAVLPVPVLAEGLRGAVSGSLAGAGQASAVLAAFAVASAAVALAALRTRLRVRPERL